MKKQDSTTLLRTSLSRVILSGLCIALSACVTAQDKRLVDSLDCASLKALERDQPTSPQTILKNWDVDQSRGYQSDDNILDQSSRKRRDSYVNRTYERKC